MSKDVVSIDEVYVKVIPAVVTIVAILMSLATIGVCILGLKNAVDDKAVKEKVHGVEQRK